MSTAIQQTNSATNVEMVKNFPYAQISISEKGGVTVYIDKESYSTAKNTFELSDALFLLTPFKLFETSFTMQDDGTPLDKEELDTQLFRPYAISHTESYIPKKGISFDAYKDGLIIGDGDIEVFKKYLAHPEKRVKVKGYYYGVMLYQGRLYTVTVANGIYGQWTNLVENFSPQKEAGNLAKWHKLLDASGQARYDYLTGNTLYEEAKPVPTTFTSVVQLTDPSASMVSSKRGVHLAPYFKDGIFYNPENLFTELESKAEKVAAVDRLASIWRAVITNPLFISVMKEHLVASAINYVKGRHTTEDSTYTAEVHAEVVEATVVNMPKKAATKTQVAANEEFESDL
jgi:hypothetical protein